MTAKLEEHVVGIIPQKTALMPFSAFAALKILDRRNQTEDIIICPMMDQCAARR